MWIKRSEYDALKEQLDRVNKQLREYNTFKEALSHNEIVFHVDYIAMQPNIYQGLCEETHTLKDHIKILEADVDFYKGMCGKLRNSMVQGDPSFKKEYETV